MLLHVYSIYSINSMFHPLLLFIINLSPLAVMLDPPTSTHLRYYGNGATLARTYNTLTTSPTITSLDLRFGHAGCCLEEHRWSFDFQPGDRFPDLRELRVSRYDFFNQDYHWRALERTWTYAVQSVLGGLSPVFSPVPEPPDRGV